MDGSKPGFALRVHAASAAGRPVEAVLAIADAEQALQHDYAASSDWLSPFDASALAMEAARCFLRLGDYAEATRQLHLALSGRKADRVRSRAFAQLMLVTALLAQGKPDDASTLANDVLENTTNLGSAVLVDHLRHVSLLFKSHANTCPEVPPLIERLEQAVHDRAWIARAAALHETSKAFRSNMTSDDRRSMRRDPVAWRAHLAAGNARQARKRVGADVLIRNGRGQVLLVDPSYKPDWDLPGGMAELNRAAAQRCRAGAA